MAAARADDAAAILTAAASSRLKNGALAIGLKAGNFVDREHVVAALREALDAVSGRAGDRSRATTIVVPDATARVFLLDFDALPPKPIEALAVIRFRLKKLLPFDSDHAAVSYQVMASEKRYGSCPCSRHAARGSERVRAGGDCSGLYSGSSAAEHACGACRSR